MKLADKKHIDIHTLSLQINIILLKNITLSSFKK